MALPAQPHPSSAALALGLCGLILSGSGVAAQYRWVDDSGVTVYSQSPPPDGKAELVQGGFKQPAPEQAKAAHEKAQQAIEADFDKREEQKKATAEKAKKAEAEARRKKQCTAARYNLEALQSPGPRRVHYPDGSYQDLSTDDAKNQRERAQQQVDDLCKPIAAPAPPASPPSLGGK